MAAKRYEHRHMIVHQSDSGSWVLDYAPGDPSQEECLGVFASHAEADAERNRLANLLWQYPED